MERNNRYLEPVQQVPSNIIKEIKGLMVVQFKKKKIVLKSGQSGVTVTVPVAPNQFAKVCL